MLRKYPFIYLSISLCAVALFGSGCKKFIEIDAPRNTVSTGALFEDSATASTALLGIYSDMMGFYINPNIGSGSITICAGQSADEFQSHSSSDQEIYNNAITPENSAIGALWSGGYGFIYQANLVIEGLDNSNTINSEVKHAFTAEASFIRAFFYFYLTNLFGDVPYIEHTDWSKNFGHGRTAQKEVYKHIIEDLKLAQQYLPDSFPPSGRVRPTKLAATALLARVYLYLDDWVNAEKEATKVISSPVFAGGLPNLDESFLKNNRGAIWQLKPNVPNYNTPEGYKLVSVGVPTYDLDSSLLEAFEPGDQRYNSWVDSVTYKGSLYFFPYKYKIRTGSDIKEYYTVLRLAEQLLIRAEARSHQSKIALAVSDLNIIRTRAALPLLATNLTPKALAAAVEQERRIELFSEWGHRWLDLKRTGKASSVLSKIKPLWKAEAVLYPIPLKEVKIDPSLGQNDGYENIPGM